MSRIDEIVAEINKHSSSQLAMTFYPSSPVSTNDMYIPVSKGHNTRRAYYMKSGQLKDYQERLFSLMTNLYGEEIMKFLDYCKSFDHLGFDVKIFIGMHDLNYKQKSIQHDIRPYDVSNYIKSFEDVLASRLEVDDKYNMRVSSCKYKSTEELGWRTTVVIRPIEHSLMTEEYIEELLRSEIDIG